ncbi:epidermal growth factor-like protein 7 isoform X1 [Elgaria multicarinata webbii]|uniref:epidermal growth factor-like protein 7 isoform X1 n=1 Tax=Elgaria multicarinata webbii TaxID=159646 RepID=UPI002FCD247A
MQTGSSLLTGLLLLCLLAVINAEHFSRSGHKVCSVEVKSHTVSYLVSHIQPVHQPYLTLCQGYRLCSTYRTTYRIAQHQAYRKVSRPAYRCCPGWRWANGPSQFGCNTAICRPPCQNGGKCVLPNRCTCPFGWAGRDCQTDVDECVGERHGCSQVCHNVAGSYRCACRRGYELHGDGKTCRALQVTTEASVTVSPARVPNRVVEDEEVKELKNRMEVLEEKFQRVLAPFLKLETLGVEGAVTDPISLLVHSVQQLDRIDSLSEQISFLEERLETCSCKNER